jgi:DNA-binding protein HU-beta
MTGVNQDVVDKVINQTMDETKKALASGKSIYLRGFGTWMAKERKAKVARDITRGTKIHVPAKKIPYFKPSKEFKELVK